MFVVLYHLWISIWFFSISKKKWKIKFVLKVPKKHPPKTQGKKAVPITDGAIDDAAPTGEWGEDVDGGGNDDDEEDSPSKDDSGIIVFDVFCDGFEVFERFFQQF